MVTKRINRFVQPNEKRVARLRLWLRYSVRPCITGSVQCAGFSLLLITASASYAQPGSTPPPDLLIRAETAGRIQPGQEAALVYLENVDIVELQRFDSSSGRTHLTFDVVAAENRYAAIMYDGDWNEVDETQLNAGTANLIGEWDEHQGLPSFTTKWVETAEVAPAEPTATAANEAPEERDLVLIENAGIAQVTKFVSRSQKTHVRFMLQAPGDDRELGGIVYGGNWDSDMLAVLRSGTANLVGYWDEYQGAPSFVLEKLE